MITPERAAAFIESLHQDGFLEWARYGKEDEGTGIGDSCRRRSCRLGRDWLHEHFGRMGDFFYELAICEDDREVNPSRERKSIGKETTFAQDIADLDELKSVLMELCKEVEMTLQE